MRCHLFILTCTPGTRGTTAEGIAGRKLPGMDDQSPVRIGGELRMKQERVGRTR